MTNRYKSHSSGMELLAVQEELDGMHGGHCFDVACEKMPVLADYRRRGVIAMVLITEKMLRPAENYVLARKSDPIWPRIVKAFPAYPDIHYGVSAADAELLVIRPFT